MYTKYIYQFLCLCSPAAAVCALLLTPAPRCVLPLCLSQAQREFLCERGVAALIMLLRLPRDSVLLNYQDWLCLQVTCASQCPDLEHV